MSRSQFMYRVVVEAAFGDGYTKEDEDTAKKKDGGDYFT